MQDINAIKLAEGQTPSALLARILEDRVESERQEKLYKRELRRRKRIEESKIRLGRESEWPQLHRFSRAQPKVDIHENPFCEERQLEDQKHMRKMTERLKAEIKQPETNSSIRPTPSWTHKLERSALAANLSSASTKHFGHRPETSQRHFNPLTMGAENQPDVSKGMTVTARNHAAKHKKIGMSVEELAFLFSESGKDSPEPATELPSLVAAESSPPQTPKSNMAPEKIKELEKNFYVSLSKEHSARLPSFIHQRDEDLSLRQRIEIFRKKAAGVEPLISSTLLQTVEKGTFSKKRVPKFRSMQQQVESEEIRELFRREKERQEKLQRKIEHHRRLVEEERYGVPYVKPIHRQQRGKDNETLPQDTSAEQALGLEEVGQSPARSTQSDSHGPNGV